MDVATGPTVPDASAGTLFCHLSHTSYAEPVGDLIWVLPVLTALTLALAGVGKVLRPEPPALVAAGLGLPDSVPWRAAIRVHPWVEIVLAVLVLLRLADHGSLVPVSVAAGAAVGLLALCVVYLVLVSLALQRGEPRCSCFGVLGDGGAVDAWTVVRNTALTVAMTPGVALIAGGRTPDPAQFWPVVALAVVVLMGAAGVGTLRRRGGRDEGRRARREVAELDAAAVGRVELALSATCGPCRYLRRRVGETGLGDDPRLVIRDPHPGELAPVAVVFDTHGHPLVMVNDPAAVDTLLTALSTRPTH